MICTECGVEFYPIDDHGNPSSAEELAEIDVCLQCQIEAARENFPELLPEEYR